VFKSSRSFFTLPSNSGNYLLKKQRMYQTSDELILNAFKTQFKLIWPFKSRLSVVQTLKTLDGTSLSELWRAEALNTEAHIYLSNMPLSSLQGGRSQTKPKNTEGRWNEKQEATCSQQVDNLKLSEEQLQAEAQTGSQEDATGSRAAPTRRHWPGSPGTTWCRLVAAHITCAVISLEQDYILLFIIKINNDQICSYHLKIVFKRNTNIINDDEVKV